MVSISARDRLRSGLRERLKRMDNERVSMMDDEDLERSIRVDIAPSVCASKLLFGGLTLVMKARFWRAFS